MDVHCCRCHSGFLFDVQSCTCLDGVIEEIGKVFENPDGSRVNCRCIAVPIEESK